MTSEESNKELTEERKSVQDLDEKSKNIHEKYSQIIELLKKG
jgi:hypothetical protein